MNNKNQVQNKKNVTPTEAHNNRVRFMKDCKRKDIPEWEIASWIRRLEAPYELPDDDMENIVEKYLCIYRNF